MKSMLMFALAALLAAPSLAADTPTPTLSLNLSTDARAGIDLGGRRFDGEWRETRCPSTSCRGEFRYIQTAHRQHVRRGTATLRSADGGRLDCQWVRHDARLFGSCASQEGKTYALVQG